MVGRAGHAVMPAGVSWSRFCGVTARPNWPRSSRRTRTSTISAACRPCSRRSIRPMCWSLASRCRMSDIWGSSVRSRAMGRSGAPARRGDRLDVDGVTIDVLSPDSAWVASQTDINEESVVLLVSYGGARLLFAGDAGMPTEAHLAGQVGRVTLLKVGHHGSRGATSDRWLDELRPAEAVISVGAKNRYGHPAPEAIARLRGHGVTVLRTDQRGTITFTVSSHGTLAIADVGHHD